LTDLLAAVLMLFSGGSFAAVLGRSVVLFLSVVRSFFILVFIHILLTPSTSYVGDVVVVRVEVLCLGGDVVRLGGFFFVLWWWWCSGNSGEMWSLLRRSVVGWW